MKISVKDKQLVVLSSFTIFKSGMLRKYKSPFDHFITKNYYIYTYNVELYSLYTPSINMQSKSFRF